MNSSSYVLYCLLLEPLAKARLVAFFPLCQCSNGAVGGSDVLIAEKRQMNNNDGQTQTARAAATTRTAEGGREEQKLGRSREIDSRKLKRDLDIDQGRAE
jgi:hypothetical protein